MKLAIIRLTSLGDIIFCMASLQIIKRHLPECSITWFADKRFADILDFNPDLSTIVKVDLKGLKKDFSFGRLLREKRRIAESGTFDMAIDLHGMIKSAVIAKKVGGIKCGFHRSVAKEPLASLIYDRTFAPPLALKAVYRYVLLTAQSLGISVEEEELLTKRPYLFYSPEDVAATDKFFESGRKNVILVAGTSLESKNYSPDKFISIANSLRENILVCHGSDHELKNAEYIAEHSPSVRVLPKMSLNQLKAAVSRADLVIGGDTGPTHIAWANNIPSITLFGPTPPCTYDTEINRVIVAPASAATGKAVKEINGIDETVILQHAVALLDR